MLVVALTGVVAFPLRFAPLAQQPDPFVTGYESACFVCHATDPRSFAPPRYPPPKIAGQDVDYLLLALRAYRSGLRNHHVMSSQIAEVPESALPQLVKRISITSAAKLPKYRPVVLDPDAVARGRKLAEANCVSCHGSGAADTVSGVPKLNGQYPRYLLSTMSDYRLGVRRSEVMTEIVTPLSARDEADLAAYYASLVALRP